MAGGCLRERNGRFYIRTRVLSIDPRTGEARWKQVEKAAGPSKRRALRMLRGLQADVEDGRFVPSGMSVAELGQKWLTEHVQPNLKPGTAASYRGTFYLHVAPALGHIRVDDCRPQMIRAMLGRKRAQGLSEAGVAKVRRHIHAMFAFAQDAGLVTANPADAARERGRKRSRRRARGTELSPVQLKLFLDQCSPRWRPFFTVALDTGLRRGELIGLQWGDVDLLERILYVRRSIGAYDQIDGFMAPDGHRNGKISVNGDTAGDDPNADGHDPRPRAPRQDRPPTTKTEAGQRLVPILGGAQSALEQLYAEASDTRDHAPVFATVEQKLGRDRLLRPTGRPLSPRMVSRVFRRYADRAGLPRTVRLHDLRHTAITNAIGQGEDVLLIAAFAGHAKTSTTVDIYGHLMPNRVRQAARRIQSLSDTVSPATPKPPS